jgi:hypothetical protein
MATAAFRSPGRSTADLTERRKSEWLAAYAECGVVRYACANAKVGVSTVYEWLDEDPTFVVRKQAAGKRAIDVLETELFRRGVLGVDEAVYWRGVPVGVVRKYSDACLIFALKALDPAKYREHVDITTGGQPLVKAYSGVTFEELGAGSQPVPTTVIEHEPKQLAAPAKRSKKRATPVQRD